MGVNTALALGGLVGVGVGFAAAFGMCFLGYRISQTHIQESKQEACNADLG